jgi:multidrug efflux pump subunit AcrB
MVYSTLKPSKEIQHLLQSFKALEDRKLVSDETIQKTTEIYNKYIVDAGQPSGSTRVNRNSGSNRVRFSDEVKKFLYKEVTENEKEEEEETKTRDSDKNVE